MLLGGHQEIFPPVDVTVLPAEELRHWSGGELCLTDVAEVPGEVYGLPWNNNKTSKQAKYLG